MKKPDPSGESVQAVKVLAGKLAFTARELGVALGVCPRTLRRLEQRGLLRSSKVLRKKLYLAADVQRFLEECRP